MTRAGPPRRRRAPARRKAVQLGPPLDVGAISRHPTPPEHLSETAWSDQVLELARVLGWMAMHPRPARHERGRGWVTAIEGDTGWPDWVFVHEKWHRAIFVELKTDAKGSKTTREQERWLRALKGAGLSVYVWRPSDIAEVQMVLASR